MAVIGGTGSNSNGGKSCLFLSFIKLKKKTLFYIENDIKIQIQILFIILIVIKLFNI